MSDPSDYGNCYFCVKTPISKEDGQIYLHADRIEIDSVGTLIFFREREGTSDINLMLAAGQWTAVYAASIFDGHAYAVDHWEGEVQR